jgi:LCP family protein required for cell wall assembly
MEQKLWVPAPPERRSGSGAGREQGGKEPGRQPSKKLDKQSRRRRARSYGQGGIRVVSLILTLGLIAICLLLVVGLGALFLGEGNRANLLLVGIDRRGGEGWAYRTDTIVVVTVDPVMGSAGMLSIPRDLQLPIPGHGEDRINTANVYGSRDDDPNAGPALLKATIEANFGIPIDGYLMADFGTFEKIVDALGGIDVDVPRALDDTHYPDPRPGDPYAFRTVHFDAGRQHMNGRRALVYARSRMSTSDFDRAKRQQLILLAIRDKALSLESIPRWPQLATTIVDGLKTDMAPGDLFRLALFAARIDRSRLKQVVLEHPLVVSYRRSDGAAVQLPNWDLINPVVTDLFGRR